MKPWETPGLALYFLDDLPSRSTSSRLFPRNGKMRQKPTSNVLWLDFVKGNGVSNAVKDHQVL